MHYGELLCLIKIRPVRGHLGCGHRAYRNIVEETDACLFGYGNMVPPYSVLIGQGFLPRQFYKQPLVAQQSHLTDAAEYPHPHINLEKARILCFI